MKIGDLLKEYRIRQGKRQKDFIGTTVSQSYYSKVEKNANRITAEDLIALLHYNNIPLWEFFSRLNCEDIIYKRQLDDLSNMMVNAYYAGDRKKLNDVKGLIDESNLSEKDKNQQKLIVDGWLESMKSTEDPRDERLRRMLKEQVFNSPNFNKNNITLYCNFMAFYDLESNRTISKQIIMQYQNSTDVKIQIAVLAIIVNMLILFIENKDLTEYKFYIKSASQVPTRPELYFYKSGVYFFENAINYQLSGDIKYLNECEQSIDNFIKLGMNSYGKRLKIFLKRYL